jgi:hypothetical protein
VEDKSRVASECERPMDVMCPSLYGQGQGTLVDIYSKCSTAGVGSS